MIIGEYSPRRSRGEYFPKITEPEANNCFSIFTQVILILFIFFVRNLYKTAASRHFVNLFLLLYSPVGEYKGMSRHIGPITASDFLCSLA